MQLEVLTMQQQPIRDVSRTTHPHLYVPQYVADEDCAEQHFLGVATPSAPAVAGGAEEEGVAARGLEGIRGTGAHLDGNDSGSSSGMSTPEMWEEDAAMQAASSRSGCTLQEAREELERLQAAGGFPSWLPQQLRWVLLLTHLWVPCWQGAFVKKEQMHLPVRAPCAH